MKPGQKISATESQKLGMTLIGKDKNLRDKDNGDDDVDQVHSGLRQLLQRPFLHQVGPNGLADEKHVKKLTSCSLCLSVRSIRQTTRLSRTPPTVSGWADLHKRRAASCKAATSTFANIDFASAPLWAGTSSRLPLSSNDFKVDVGADVFFFLAIIKTLNSKIS